MMTSESEVIQCFKGEIFTDDIIGDIGDDAAVIGSRKDKPEWFVTSDQIAQDVHFLPGRHPSKLLGEKLVSINVSDILAMGGKPHSFLINILFRDRNSEIDLLEFSEGVKKASGKYRTTVIGGDTATTSKDGFYASITMLGKPVADLPILRSEASPGEKIYVTGEPGLSATGLELLRSDRPFEDLITKKAVKTHLSPELPFELLGTDFFDYPSSMIDIRDGLLKDLSRICNSSKTGALLDEKKIENISPESVRENILYGGEDYQLLFTVPSGNEFKDFIENTDIKITEIGRMTDKQNHIAGQKHGTVEELDIRGYNHMDKYDL